MKFHHIGIFCNTINEGKKNILNLFKPKKISKITYDKNLGVKVLFITDKDNIMYEIVAPYGKKNPVSKILKQKKNILNHIAYKVKNFDNVILKLRSKGFAPLGRAQPALAFKNMRVCFFLTPLNFIIEVIESV